MDGKNGWMVYGEIRRKVVGGGCGGRGFEKKRRGNVV